MFKFLEKFWSERAQVVHNMNIVIMIMVFVETDVY